MLNVSSITWDVLKEKEIYYDIEKTKLVKIALLMTYINNDEVTRDKKDILTDILALCNLKVTNITAPNATSIMFQADLSGRLQFILNNYTHIECVTECGPGFGTVYFKPVESSNTNTMSSVIDNYKIILNGGGKTYSFGYVSICMNKINSYQFPFFTENTYKDSQIYQWQETEKNHWDLLQDQPIHWNHNEWEQSELPLDGLVDFLNGYFFEHISSKIRISKSNPLLSGFNEDNIPYTMGRLLIILGDTWTIMGIRFQKDENDEGVYLQCSGKELDSVILDSQGGTLYWGIVTLTVRVYGEKTSQFESNMLMMGFNKISYPESSYANVDTYWTDGIPYLKVGLPVEFHVDEDVSGCYLGEMYKKANNGVIRLANWSYPFNSVQFERKIPIHMSLMKLIETTEQSYLKNSVGIVNGKISDPSYSIIDRDYQSNSGNFVSSNTLQAIDIKHVDIPKYKISENTSQEAHIQVVSFPNNYQDMSPTQKWQYHLLDKQGYNKLPVSKTLEVNAKHWTTKPQIYPEIVFNNTSNSVALPNSISLDENILNIGGNNYTIYDSDLVVVYEREPGWVKPNQQLSTFWHYRPDSQYQATRYIIDLELSGTFNSKIEASIITNGDSWQPQYGIPFNTITDRKLYTEHLSRIVKYTSNTDSITMYITGVSDLIGEKARDNVFQFGWFDGYKESDWKEHCNISMQLDGQIPYISTENLSLSKIINYKSEYNANINEKCTENQDMKGYISSVSDLTCNAELSAKYTCNNGTLPSKIDCYSKTTVGRTLMATQGHKYYRSYSYINGVYTAKTERYIKASDWEDFVTDGNFNLTLGFYSKTDPVPAIAVVIWRNGKLFDEY